MEVARQLEDNNPRHLKHGKQSYVCLVCCLLSYTYSSACPHRHTYICIYICIYTTNMRTTPLNSQRARPRLLSFEWGVEACLKPGKLGLKPDFQARRSETMRLHMSAWRQLDHWAPRSGNAKVSSQTAAGPTALADITKAVCPPYYWTLSNTFRTAVKEW